MGTDKNIFFEQYKLYVGTAEKVSEKRQIANKYFLSLNSFLLVFSGYFELWYLAIAGISICVLWLLNLQSYRSLNSAKYVGIHKMEEQLPVKLFDDEWTLLDKGENKRKYFKLSVAEQGVPIVFMFLYWIILALSLLPI